MLDLTTALKKFYLYSDAAPGPAGDGQTAVLFEQHVETGEPAQPAETDEHAQPEAKFSCATAAAIVDEGKCLQVKSGNLFCQSHLNFIKESKIINVAFV